MQALARAAFTAQRSRVREFAEYEHWMIEVKLDALARQPILGIIGSARVRDAAPRYAFAIKLELSN